jgi:uncharacterized protein
MRKHAFTAIAAVCLMALALSGCKDKSGSTSAAPVPAKDNSRLTIATAGTTGVFYAYGGALASTISKGIPGLAATAQATGGSVENLKLIASKQVDLALTSADVAHSAYFVTKDGKYFKEKVEFKALFNMYPEPLHLITGANSSVNSVKDFKGKRVVVGAPGSGTEMKSRAVLKGLGVEYKDFTPEYLSFSEGTEALKDKTVDVAILGVLYPAPAVVELSMHNPIRLISLSDNEIETLVKSNNIFVRSVIPGKTYTNVDKDVNTIAVQTLVVCRADLPDDVAYKIVKEVFENKDKLNVMHSSFKETTLEHATPTIVPLHPGAKKYFEEKKAYKEFK